MAKQKAREQFVSPIGVARYPFLQDPDKKFNPESPVYRVELIFNLKEPDAYALQQHLDSQFEKVIKEPECESEGDKPYKLEKDEDTGDDLLVVRFKLKSRGKDPRTGETWTSKPRIFDSKGNLYEGREIIGSGSRLRVAFTINPYHGTRRMGSGISLRLRSVQIHTMVAFAGFNPFDELEDGFVAQEDPLVESSEDTTRKGGW